MGNIHNVINILQDTLTFASGARRRRIPHPERPLHVAGSASVTRGALRSSTPGVAAAMGTSRGRVGAGIPTRPPAAAGPRDGPRPAWGRALPEAARGRFTMAQAGRVLDVAAGRPDCRPAQVPNGGGGARDRLQMRGGGARRPHGARRTVAGGGAGAGASGRAHPRGDARPIDARGRRDGNAGRHRAGRGRRGGGGRDGRLLLPCAAQRRGDARRRGRGVPARRVHHRRTRALRSAQPRP